MKGEEVYDDTVWVVKSHSPWTMPDAPIYHSNKCIVVVRNPLDSLPSWFNFLAMQSHAIPAPFNVQEEYPDFWDFWVRD